MARPLRVLSYAIDTALLAAGLGLAVMLRLNPLVVSWLGVKIGLLSIYIVFGSMALISWPPYARLVRAQVLSLPLDQAHAPPRP